ncbi:MAG: DegT/DnrJ/EryC1/StrS family aminotransferase [Flavobacteriales bacterium]|nr:DegT/DnrJ/EryC1/StrS family aminotransferase [Flavobacteriales bacterium]
MKQIPFSPPHIDQTTIDAVVEVLKSGWITTGPRVRELESEIAKYVGTDHVLCLNSWTNAAELVLRWFGVGPGDEVILPAYTYAATANIVCHLGATPVLIDSEKDNFLIDLNALKAAITVNTKVIMPVDIGGLPVDYDQINAIAKEYAHLFNASNDVQKMLGRTLVLGDTAHSFGATYKGKKCGAQTDVMVFSFHAVKNLTTAEGGAVTIQLPEPFNNQDIRKSLNISALHGQTKDALSKTQAGQWQYDIIEAGYKCNLTDVHAAIGLSGLKTYDSLNLPARQKICERYNEFFREFDWAITPEFKTEMAVSSYHLYMLRINRISEAQRDEVIDYCAQQGVSTNVHFQPLPRLSFYKNLGYQENDYPHAMKQFASEISLPVYMDLSESDQLVVMNTLKQGVENIL